MIGLNITRERTVVNNCSYQLVLLLCLHMIHQKNHIHFSRPHNLIGLHYDHFAILLYEYIFVRRQVESSHQIGIYTYTLLSGSTLFKECTTWFCAQYIISVLSFHLLIYFVYICVVHSYIYKIASCRFVVICYEKASYSVT